MGGSSIVPYSASSLPSTLSPLEAKKRINTLFKHASSMLEHLQKQNEAAGLTAKKSQEIYTRAQANLDQIAKRLIIESIREENQVHDAYKKAEAQVKEDEQMVEALNQQLLQLHNRTSRFLMPFLYTRRRKAIEVLNAKLEQSQEQLALRHQELENKPQPSKQTTDLKQKEIKNLAAKLKSAESAIVKIIRDAQIDAVAEIGAQDQEDAIKSNIATLARGGWSARWLRFLATVFKTSQAAKAAQCFSVGRAAIEQASKKDIEELDQTQVDQERRQEFQDYQQGKANLERRAGVIGLKGVYRFQVAFSKKAIKHQFKSFEAQALSEQERKAIRKNMSIKGKLFTSQHIPLNQAFDEFLSLKSTLSSVFSKIFGKQGVASSNRPEPHLINGWETQLIYQGKSLFRALRHAITSDKHEKDPLVRAANSKKAAEELLKAALLQELASQGLSLQEAREKGLEQPLRLNLNSVSLVTPDDLRPAVNPILRFFGFKEQADEQAMLLDQMHALKSLAGEQKFNLDGVELDVDVHVQTFNFGVNQGAVDGIGLGRLKARVGLQNQYVHNVEAWESLSAQMKDFILPIQAEASHLAEELRNPDMQNSEERGPLEERLKNMQTALVNINHLLADIRQMMEDHEAYLKGDNQYEIGAKILLLTNVLNQAIEGINQHKGPNKPALAGFTCAFNCMSGKDRTGVLDAVTKTFAILAAENGGIYPSHRQFLGQTKEAQELRKEFATLLTQVLLESGSLEITELNTGAKGYKVGSEARLFGIPLEQFLQIQGLSATTSS